ncbi:probable inactive shikimate kinase like 2, chloroplastic [Syzygium oleosum]|uniref:probable inactive shikimate kinase like 2, chloroplastic n=1 Tax=Syzygium oleosum TaxID=219896 RepID=UPI0024BB75E6|nr:probable inactive shikimate kinase like 2, chloroplastic [Syzygium oleosum]
MQMQMLSSSKVGMPITPKPWLKHLLSALKRLVLSDRKLPDKKSLYIRLGCRGDWPNVKPPGWDPSTADDSATSPDTL